jgi:hypothetical protein
LRRLQPEGMIAAQLIATHNAAMKSHFTMSTHALFERNRNFRHLKKGKQHEMA